MKGRLLLAVLAATSIGAVLADPPGDAAKPDVPALAQEALERSRAQPVQPKIGTYDEAQRGHVRDVADGARQRARAALDELAVRSPFTPKPDTAADAAGLPKPKAPLAGRVVVALSSSMPDQMWRDYMAQLDGHPEAIVVLRGFVGGARTVTPTGALIERVRRNEPAEPRGRHRVVDVVVDPLLYRSLGIDRVPAVVWLPGVNDISHCEDRVFEAAVTVYGAVSVGYALEQIDRNGGSVPTAVLQAFGAKG